MITWTSSARKSLSTISLWFQSDRQVLTPQMPVKPANIERYKVLNSALQEAEEFSPIFLNDLCPHDVRQRRYYYRHSHTLRSLATIPVLAENPSKQSVSQYTGRLRVKHMVQARELRKFHPDAHYASALFRYLRLFAVRYSSSCTFASLDDKHHCKVGEPNYPVTAVERGKAVLVSLDKPSLFQTVILQDLVLSLAWIS